MVETIEWTAGGVVMIDQTRLPMHEEYVTCRTYQEVAAAIRDMIIRGAPAIGVAAAMGVAIGVQHATEADLDAQVDLICDTLARTRPTAVNLFWAIDRMKRLYTALRGQPLDEIRERLIQEAQLVREEDIAINRAIGRHGAASRAGPQDRAHALQCRRAGHRRLRHRAGRDPRGARERQADRCLSPMRPARFCRAPASPSGNCSRTASPTTLITDNMAGHFMKSGRIGCVVVGADRIAGNGDVANKIGTYSVAVLAKENGVPFFVAAPVSTLDLTLASGDQIPIEQRAASEVTHVFGHPVAPEGTAVQNPAFDVTPARYVTAIITENGVARAPYQESLKGLLG